MSKRLFILLLVIAAAFGIYSLRSNQKSSQETTLTVYCAAGMKKPVEAIASQYEQEVGVRISLQFGGTGTLLTQLRVANKGDLFIAADEGSLAEAQKLKVTRETFPLALQRPVLAVAKGNPKNIHTLADLERADVRFALANPEAASIGKITQKLLGERWVALAAKAAVMKPTVTEIAADAKLGAVDAAIIWDSIVPQFSGLEMVTVPELSGHQEKASIAVLVSAASPQEALRFAHYLAAPNKGGILFKSHGFTPAGGDEWKD